MPLPLIAGALGLAIDAAPSIVKWIAGDESRAAQVAEEAAGLARQVTGEADSNAAVAALRADPGAFVEFQKLMADKAVALAQEETAQLREREQSWREQARSDDAYVRRARPTIIYALVVIGLAAAATAVVVAWREPVLLPETIAALQWVVYALAGVGGLYVVKRSDDKAVERGQEPPTRALTRLASALVNRPSAPDPN